MVHGDKVRFVDSTKNTDTASHTLTFIIAPSYVGAMPLAAIITASESRCDFKFAFEQYKKLDFWC